MKQEQFGRRYRYSVSKEAFDNTLKLRSDKEKKMNPYVWYKELIMRENGLLGYCVEVVVH